MLPLRLLVPLAEALGLLLVARPVGVLPRSTLLASGPSPKGRGSADRTRLAGGMLRSIALARWAGLDIHLAL